MSYQTTLSLVAALAILLSAQMVPGQCLQSPGGETAVGLKEASSHFLVFYMDDLDKGGVPAGYRSVDFFVWPGEDTLRADARVVILLTTNSGWSLASND